MEPLFKQSGTGASSADIELHYVQIHSFEGARMTFRINARRQRKRSWLSSAWNYSRI